MKFEFLPHTADIRMRIEAETLPLLFQAGLRGMSHILKEDYCPNEQKRNLRRVFAINAADITCLLIDFLSEVLTLSYTEKSVFCDLNFVDFSEKLISAEISGSAVADGFDEEIKAVTYHEAAVTKNNEGLWETVVVFDI